MKTYLFTFSISLCLTLLSIPVVRRLALKVGLVDHPDARKVHSKPVPRVGGIAFVLSILISSAFAFWSWQDAVFAAMPKEVVTLLIASLFIFAVGLIDDYRQLTGKIKFAALFLASFAVYYSGSGIHTLTVGKLFSIELGWTSWLLTALWISGITVGVNFLDGLDGLAGGLCAIAACVIAILAFYVGAPVIALIMLAVVGGLAGFLYFNRYPAKVFMGDCGSMFLGFILGASSIICASKSSHAIEVLGITAVVLGIPIIDAGCTMIRRGILERRSIFNAERGHIHHRLLDLGLHQRHVVIILYLVTIVTTTLAMFTLITSGVDTIAILSCILLLYLVFFRAIGSYNVQHTIQAIKRNRAIKRDVKRYKDFFEDAQLQARRVESFDQWWQTVCSAAEQMDFNSISLPITNRDGTRRILEWKRNNSATQQPDASNDLKLNHLKPKTPAKLAHLTPKTCPSNPLGLTPDPCSQLIHTSLPIKDRRTGSSLRLIIDIPADGSLESSNLRVTLFSRLLDEHSIADLPGKTKT